MSKSVYAFAELVCYGPLAKSHAVKPESFQDRYAEGPLRAS